MHQHFTSFFFARFWLQYFQPNELWSVYCSYSDVCCLSVLFLSSNKLGGCYVSLQESHAVVVWSVTLTLCKQQACSFQEHNICTLASVFTETQSFLDISRVNTEWSSDVSVAISVSSYWRMETDRRKTNFTHRPVCFVYHISPWWWKTKTVSETSDF
jgi:hypothetical protein